MPTVKLEPSSDHPVPYDLTPDGVGTHHDALASAAATADLLVGLGAPVEVDPEDYAEETRLIDAVTKGKKTAPLKSLPVAVGASAFLRAYGQQAALDMAQVRSALTHKLLEIADCGEIKYELKAIELLGKHSDVGLFTERSEINVNYNSPEALETAIKERVKRLLNADVVDIKPLSMDLDEELGILDGEFADVYDPGDEGGEAAGDEGATDE
jgi:hypothetical protein